MPWLLVDIAIALVALALLTVVGIRLIGTIRRVTRSMAEANVRLAEASAALDAVPRPTPPTAPDVR